MNAGTVVSLDNLGKQMRSPAGLTGRPKANRQGLYPQPCLHLGSSQLRNGVGSREWGERQVASVPSYVAPRAPGRAPGCAAGRGVCPAGSAPGPLDSRPCLYPVSARSPGAACTWPWLPGPWRRAGQRRDLSGTFLGWGWARSPRLQLPPRAGRAPAEARALAGSGCFCCTNAVAGGSAHPWVRGILRPISGTWPGEEDRAGTEITHKADC